MQISGPAGGTSVAYATANLQGAPGNDVVPQGTITPLTWGQYAGATLLDYTNPLAPTAIVDGVYAVTVTIVCGTAGEAGGWLFANLDLDLAGTDFFASATLKLDPNTPDATTSQSNRPQVPISLTGWVPAGGIFKTTVAHNVTGTLEIGQEIMVQRIA